jgi:hypothetical protein
MTPHQRQREKMKFMIENQSMVRNNHYARKIVEGRIPDSFQFDFDANKITVHAPENRPEIILLNVAGTRLVAKKVFIPARTFVPVFLVEYYTMSSATNPMETDYEIIHADEYFVQKLNGWFRSIAAQHHVEANNFPWHIKRQFTNVLNFHVWQRGQVSVKSTPEDRALYLSTGIIQPSLTMTP